MPKTKSALRFRKRLQSVTALVRVIFCGSQERAKLRVLGGDPCTESQTERGPSMKRGRRGGSSG